jgi:hypothetical protein
MKKRKFISAIFILACFILTNCDKRPFAHIELHGRVLDSKTSAPVQATVTLWTGETPHSKGSTSFGSVSTNSDGTFDIKSKAGWNSNDYYLEVVNSTSTGASSTYMKYTVNKNQNIDVGIISL